MKRIAFAVSLFSLLVLSAAGSGAVAADKTPSGAACPMACCADDCDCCTEGATCTCADDACKCCKHEKCSPKKCEKACEKMEKK